MDMKKTPGCDLFHMEIKQDLKELKNQVSELALTVAGIPDKMNDIFIKNGLDPEAYIENQETASLIRKFKKFDAIWSRVISTLIVYGVLTAFGFYYFNNQTNTALLRDEKYIQKIIDKSKGE